jgi:hypothetical protein
MTIQIAHHQHYLWGAEPCLLSDLTASWIVAAMIVATVFLV